jgi:hypothetical protein
LFPFITFARMSKTSKTKVKTAKPAEGFVRAENWFAQNNKKVFYTLTFASVFFSLLYFNARISEAHDDALYLEAGWRYVNEFPNYFYTQNAPLYPLFLGLLTKLFGFKLFLFKLFSVLFNVLGFVLFYKSFEKRVPYVIFIPVAVFSAINHLILYYASMTFTEAFYFFLLGVFFFTATKVLDLIQKENTDLKKQWKLWLMLGFSMFLLSTAKSGAIVVVPAVVLYFFIEKNWKALWISLGSYISIKVLYELLVKLIWSAPNQFKGQGKILLQKDPYDASKGTEDLSGFIGRFFDNCDLYLSKRFFQIIGWRDEMSTDVYGLLGFLVIIITSIGLFLVFKQKNKPLFLFGLFTGAQIILSFIILQTRWDQARIILVCMPIMLLLIFYAFHHYTYKNGTGRLIYSAVILLVIGSVFLSSVKRASNNIPIVAKNLKGDKYYGYTPDWQNYLRCSEWCADSLSKESLVACRKAPMSFVYGKGKTFFPIYSVIKKDTATQQSHPDSALVFFEKNKVTHIMVANLRMNPNENNGQIINTIHHIIQPIMEKYPNKLKLIHTEGYAEECYVLEITK